jgi:SAM-dependent methyltransferase
MFNCGNSYESKYKHENFFQYNNFLYQKYIFSLFNFLSIKKGSSILDIGCGQGYFTYLFSRFGLNAFGVDLSKNGIKIANNKYKLKGCNFLVGDCLKMPFKGKFDVLFVRSCSLYNDKNFGDNSNISKYFIDYLKNGGFFIFVYNTKFYKKNDKCVKWLYHNICSVEKHFKLFENPKIFFSLRIETLIFKSFAFNKISSKINFYISKMLGVGGDIICVINKV